MIARLQRDTLLAQLALVVVALVLRPRDWRLAAGILGGGLLAALSYWALRGAIEAVSTASQAPSEGGAPAPKKHDDSGTAENAKTSDFRPISRGFVLVKFFTRHAILALAAYGMMTRLRLDPIGMLIGVSAPVLAAALESLRYLRKS